MCTGIPGQPCGKRTETLTLSLGFKRIGAADQSAAPGGAKPAGWGPGRGRCMGGLRPAPPGTGGPAARARPRGCSARCPVVTPVGGEVAVLWGCSGHIRTHVASSPRVLGSSGT